MAITRQKKEDVVKNLRENFANAKVVVFTDYKGMGVNEITALRRKVRETGGLFVVAKKSLLDLATKDNRPEGLDPLGMEGQIAIAFGFEDSVATAKAVNESKKEVERPAIIAGLMDGALLSEAEVVHLASLPTRDELVAQVVGTIKAPINGFANVLGGNLRNLVYALNAIGESKN